MKCLLMFIYEINETQNASKSVLWQKIATELLNKVPATFISHDQGYNFLLVSPFFLIFEMPLNSPAIPGFQFGW